MYCSTCTIFIVWSYILLCFIELHVGIPTYVVVENGVEQQPDQDTLLNVKLKPCEIKIWCHELQLDKPAGQLTAFYPLGFDVIIVLSSQSALLSWQYYCLKEKEMVQKENSSIFLYRSYWYEYISCHNPQLLTFVSPDISFHYCSYFHQHHSQICFHLWSPKRSMNENVHPCLFDI